MRVKDPGTFIKQIVGTQGRFTTEDITAQLRNIIVSRFTDILGENRIPLLDLAANYDELGKFLGQRMQPDFAGMGVELPQLLVENISLPPAVEEALDKRSSMGVIGDLSRYTQYQAAESMKAAAENPGGTAGGGIGMGMGFAMANQMGQAMGKGGGAGGPPPLPGQGEFFVAAGGKQTGPFDVASLTEQAKAGQFTRESLVWKQGMEKWTPASQVYDLSAVFAQVPPPLTPGASTPAQAGPPPAQ
jgi:hypothetical protein